MRKFMPSVFIAYPSKPIQIGQTINRCSEQLQRTGISVATWEELDVPGRFIATGVLKDIESADILAVDLTKLSFNVTFEAGYAMARGKRILPVLNRSLQSDKKDWARLGIFDALSYREYENADELARIVEEFIANPTNPAPTFSIETHAPVYLLDTDHKTDASLRIFSKIKKAKLYCRSFDPQEQYRLVASDAYKQVAHSVAVVVHLLASNSVDYAFNNQRAAFIMGLAIGFDKELLAFQEGDEPVPLDYRDLVTVYRALPDIDEAIYEFAPRVTEALQQSTGALAQRDRGTLEALDLGSTAAENEIIRLGEYYVPIDAFNQTLAGNVRLVVGRKGSGKTALFLQVRDKVRSFKRQKLVLDLKPEGHQLKRFKETVLYSLSEAVREHAATAFWEYSLLLELTLKLLEADRQAHLRDKDLLLRYENLAALYESTGALTAEGDFSERLRELTERISEEFKDKYGNEQISRLSVAQITDLIYRQHINTFREALADYLNTRDEVWILFDNIDKSWPAHGVDSDDILILRALLDASRKLEQFFVRHQSNVRTVVFIRNDVYDLLIGETSDKGKEAKVSLDWTDPDRLRELVRRRLVRNVPFKQSDKFQNAWSQICISHVEGLESSDYLIERSLMRPRYLLTLINYAKSNAVNLNHNKIEVSDIQKACKAYSADILADTGYELRDIYPNASDDLLYNFWAKSPVMSKSEVNDILSGAGIPQNDKNKVIELLLWFSFFGITLSTGQDVYVYDVLYDMKKMKVQLAQSSSKLCIHRSFWPFLDIQGHGD